MVLWISVRGMPRVGHTSQSRFDPMCPVVVVHSWLGDKEWYSVILYLCPLSQRLACFAGFFVVVFFFPLRTFSSGSWLFWGSVFLFLPLIWDIRGDTISAHPSSISLEMSLLVSLFSLCLIPSSSMVRCFCIRQRSTLVKHVAVARNLVGWWVCARTRPNPPSLWFVPFSC